MPRGSGRRPKPTAIKAREGNRGKRPLNPNEPQGEPGEPEMPEGLDTLAEQEWKRIVPRLLALGVLTKIDGKALAAYCAAFARWREAEDSIAKYGLIIEEPVIDKSGLRPRQLKLRGRNVVRLKANPAAAKSSDAMKLMKSFLVEFGMTPASRSRLSTNANGDKPADPADKYFSGEAGRRSGHTVQ